MRCNFEAEGHSSPPTSIWGEQQPHAYPLSSTATEFSPRLVSILKASIQPATAEMYQHHWNVFLNFLRKTTDPIFLVHPIQLAPFLVHLHEQCLTYITIRTYLSAIAFVHKLAGHPNPTDAFLITKTMQGIKSHQAHKASDPLQPISRQILHQLIDALAFAVYDPYSRAMWKAIFLLAYHACLRAGVVVYSGNDKNILHLYQVNIYDTTATITFSSYKHSRGNTPTLTIQAEPQGTYCPLQALRHYLAHRGTTPGYLFIHANSSPASRLQFSKVLKSALIMSGHDARRFNTHSFRVGRATQLAGDNYSDSTIRAAGRWRSSAYQQYIRPSNVVLPQ